MKSIALCTTILTSLLAATSASAIDRLVEGFPDLPKDARVVAGRGMACQHFWGEASGTGDARDRDVAKQLKRLGCHHVERDLERIRVKYRNRPEVLRILDEAGLR